MTPEEFADEVLVPWANVDDRVTLLDPSFQTIDEAWEISFEDGTMLLVTVKVADS